MSGGGNSSTSGKSMDAPYDICDGIADVQCRECSANRASGMDARTHAACTTKVEARRSACYTTARQFTDNGPHPAP
jgi:hypothetical protein